VKFILICRSFEDVDAFKRRFRDAAIDALSDFVPVLKSLTDGFNHPPSALDVEKGELENKRMEAKKVVEGLEPIFMPDYKDGARFVLGEDDKHFFLEIECETRSSLDDELSHPAFRKLFAHAQKIEQPSNEVKIVVFYDQYTFDQMWFWEKLSPEAYEAALQEYGARHLTL
jgi:hypothetical protein